MAETETTHDGDGKASARQVSSSAVMTIFGHRVNRAPHRTPCHRFLAAMLFVRLEPFVTKLAAV